MKIALLFFLSIYSWRGAPASWAARYTTVCLDVAMLPGYAKNWYRGRLTIKLQTFYDFKEIELKTIKIQQKIQ